MMIRKKYTIPKQWFFCLLTFTIVGIMLCLGCWQLQRYHAKSAMLQACEQSSVGPVLSWSDFLKYGNRPFYPVRIFGYYLNDRTFLLDHRWQNGHLGYEVLTPFKILKLDGSTDVRLVLVNRRWVPAPASRKSLPAIQPIEGRSWLDANVLLPAKPGFMLGPNIEPANRWPVRIQQIRISDIARTSGFIFYPYVLRPRVGSAPLVCAQQFNMTPERHFSYAVQWFLLSVSVMIAYFIFVRSQRGR